LPPFRPGGLLCALGNVIRPVGVIVVCAVFIFELLNAIKHLSRKDYSKAVTAAKKFALFALVYFGVLFCCSAAVKASGVNQNGLADNFPEWKLVLGLNAESVGTYNDADVSALMGITDRAARDARARALIKQRLSPGAGKLAQLFYEKSAAMWCGYDDMEWEFGGLDLPRAQNRTAKLSLGFYAAIFLLLIFGCVIIIRDKRFSGAALILALAALLYFGAHLFIEIQVRYREFLVLLIFPLISFAIELWRRE